LLDTGGAEVLQDHLRKRPPGVVFSAILGDVVNQIVVLVDA
jgi:hypothetical protein